MKKMFLKLCSSLLCLILLVNMLPMSIFAEEFQQNLAQKETITTTEEIISAKPTQIVNEIPEKRTKYAKEYMLNNGMRMAVVYPDAVHYQKDGKWQEIDNTLTSKTIGVLTNTAGSWEVSFPQQLTKAKKITIEKDGYTLSFGMADELRNTGLEVAAVQSNLTAAEQAETFSTTAMQNTTATIEKIDLTAVKNAAEYPETVSDKLQSRLKYACVFENTDVTYDLDSNTVKESIILKAYSSTLRGYRYTLEVGQLRPVLEKDGQITFYDSKQENVIMVMPAPYLVDSAQEMNTDIQVQLTGSGSTYTLTYILPQQWLAAEERQWPVILDPVVQGDTTKKNIQDVTVSEGKTYDHKWGMLQCGHSDTYGLSRFYVKYESLPDITSSDVVLAATMSIYKHVNGTAGADDMVIEAHKVTAATWEAEGMTWATKPGFDTTIEDYEVVNVEGFYNWDITDVVRNWYASNNNGVMFKVPDNKENVTTDTFRQFRSVDYGYNRPTLQIFFRNNNGLESYWDYSSASAGRAGTGYVNQFTGNLTWVRADIGFGGHRMPVSINHIYNLNDSKKITDSNNANNTAGVFFGLGCGWRTNFHQRVYQWDVDDDYYVWEDSDGTDHYFLYSSANTYKDEDGMELTLKTNGSGTGKYTITDKNGNISYFDTTGRLTKQSNNQATKSSITITYTADNKPYIQQIKDGAGRKYIFSYNDSDQLIRISYQGIGTTEISYVSFTYTGNRLTKVTDADGKSCTYSYGTDYTNNAYLLETVKDVDGYTLTYTYNNPAETWRPYRVKEVQESHNNTNAGKLTFTYNHNETVIKDQTGKAEYYQFNNMGNTVSVRDARGRAMFNQFALNSQEEAEDNADATKKNNQLRVSSKLQYSVANYLANNSFETGNSWTSDSNSLTLSRSTAAAYRGQYSLKMTNNSTGNVVAKSSSIGVGAGVTFTFSVYVKSEDATGRIAVQCGDTIQNGTNFAAGIDWKRLQLTYTNNTSATVNINLCVYLKTQGSAYIDCVQLEKNTAAGRLNLLENGDFIYASSSFPSNWTGNGTTSSDIVDTPSSTVPGLHRKAFKVTGSASAVKRIYQTLNISGSAGNTYVLGGWAKGNSVPLRDSRKFSLIATFNNTDGTTTTAEVKFNPDTENWQYVALPLKAKKAYSSIKIEVAYDYNINTVWFDGIQLFRERIGGSFSYDSNGNLVSVKNNQGQTTQYEYTNNNLTKEILPSGAELTYTYDDYHNVKTATTEAGQVYSFTYDAYGNNTSVSITSGGTTMTSSATYTNNGNRTVTTTDTAGNVTRYQYNVDTNVLEWVRYPKDTEATRTNYTYDEMYRMTQATDKVSRPYYTETSNSYTQRAAYVYENDMLKSVTTTGETYNFTYGNFGLRTGVSVGSRNLATYSYTQDGNNYLDTLDYGNEDSVKYTYNSDGSLAKQTYEDGAQISYAYDDEGNLSIVKDSATDRTGRYYYDITGRLNKRKELGTGCNFTVSYGFDSGNRLSSSKENLNGDIRSITYTYDGDNRVTTYKKGNVSQNYTYDGFGRNTQKVVKNGSSTLLTSTNTFRTVSGNPTGQVATLKNQAANYNVTYTYTYDSNGNILSVNDGTYTTTYEYDESNQLIRENNQKAGYTHVWVYDSAGNIRYKKIFAYTTAATLGTPTQTITYAHGNSAWTDLLTAVGDQAYTYDQIGNLLSDGTRTYTWKHGRQLATLTQDNKTWSITYDSQGMRASRTAGSTAYKYYYSDGKLISMTCGNDTLYFAYTPDGLPYSVEYNGTQYVYALNLQGDVMAILNTAGTAVVEYTYDAWGNILSCTGSMASTLGQINPLRYRGYVYDNETQLYYLQSRYYDPEIGRFINADAQISAPGSEILGNNMYAYCFNNPVNSSDPNGNWPKWLSGALNVVSGAVQMAAGVAIGVAAGWTGAGAVAAGFLLVNGAATATQGIGQIVNDATKSNVLSEDNIVRSGVQATGKAIGGKTGEKVAGTAYDAAVIASGLYAGTVGLDKAMPSIVKSKVFSANNGYGLKLGNSIEMLYRNPNAAGGLGGTIFSYKGPLGKFRIDWDPTHSFHSHPPGH